MIPILLIALLMMGCINVSKQEKSPELIVSKTPAYVLYVYSDETGLWNRARRDDLMNAKCEKLHIEEIP